MHYWTLSQLRSFCFFNSKHKYTKEPLKHLQGKEARRQISQFKIVLVGFPGGAMVKNPPANAGDTGSSPGPGGSHILRSI